MIHRQRPPDPARIYVLPNLMTAGNLICGFMAVLKIIEGTLQREAGSEQWVQNFQTSLIFILGAFFFDMLDGRLARLGGRENAFGREFDSLADVVSFGVAPALLVFKIVLVEFAQLGWIIAVFYLLCGCMRLARFNVHATMDSHSSSKEFTGFPIPAAAGTIASITLFLLHLYETRAAFQTGYGKYALAALMVFLSLMMMSRFKYPSFKSVSWRTEHSAGKFLLLVGLIVLVVTFLNWMPAVLFISYLLYGFIRPFLSRGMRREIEDDEDDESTNGESRNIE
jgi:CDP-diacylglycerol--serine O-phosphatidyltransferase